MPQMTASPTLTSAAATAPAAATPTSGTPTPPAATETSAAPWYQGLPENLANDTTVQGYTSLEAAMHGLVAGRKMIGDKPENFVRRPAAGDKEAMRSTLTEMGLMPADRAEYALKAFEGAPGDYTPEGPLAKVFNEACFEAGVPHGAMQQVFEQIGGYLGQFSQQEAQQREAAESQQMAALQQELGAATADTLSKAEMVLNHFGVTKDINDSGLGTNPALIKMAAQLFPMLQEDATGGRAENGRGGLTGVKTPQQYRQEAVALQQQAINERIPSRRMELSQQAQRLYQLANAK